MDVGDDREEAEASPWLLIMIFGIWCWHWTKCSKKERKTTIQVLVVGNNEYDFTYVEFEVPIEHQGEDTLLKV